MSAVPPVPADGDENDHKRDKRDGASSGVALEQAATTPEIGVVVMRVMIWRGSLSLFQVVLFGGCRTHLFFTCLFTYHFG
jgi:hypothetical protein